MRNPLFAVAVAAALIALATPNDSTPAPVAQPEVMTTAGANELIQRQPGFFVPNLGQWMHAARFVHRSGPMTLFLEDRGWVIDLVERPVEEKPTPHASHRAMPDDRDVERKIRGVALRMTFEGDGHVPDIVGEKILEGHHNYFLGSDERRWRTDVPLYSSVRYENLYPGIDLRLREMNGVPEYDLLLQPGADLAAVTVHVEGGKGLSIAKDGSLVIATALGPMIQSAPKTWQMGSDGRKCEVACNFTLLGARRFGFAAPGWNGDTSLTVDPGLIWSTFLGGSTYDVATALSTDASGMVTVAGGASSANFPTSIGAYDATHNGADDAFVSRLDPSKLGRAQLVYSTFLGGGASDRANALHVDARGVATVTGRTQSPNLPTTNGAYDRTPNSSARYGNDVFVSRLDPRQNGTGQLVYSTYLGGTTWDVGRAVSVDASGVVTVAGLVASNTPFTNFPTTRGAYDTTYDGGGGDAFVSRLDPSKFGTAQLVYSTFLGGGDADQVHALSVGAGGVVTVAGKTLSWDFPTSIGAYDATHNGSNDLFISRLDPNKIGAAQLVYSTFLGGSLDDMAYALSVDASGVTTVTGRTQSRKFPTTNGAYDRTYNSGGAPFDGNAFVTRLDPQQTGTAQLTYSTFLGGSRDDGARALSVDASGVVTVAGWATSANFPTTPGAFDTTHNGSYDAFVSRLDPQKTGNAQLLHSTFLGASGSDSAYGLTSDASGVVTVAGWTTSSANFPTTRGAYDTTHNGVYDIFVSRLDMGVALWADVYAISITAGGTQRLTVHAGKAHANRSYWIFGSETGTRPGINLLGVHIPLNPDLYTVIAMSAPNGKEFKNFKGTLDANGLATASFNLPAKLPFPSGFTFHHAYVVYDASGRFYMASNPVPLRLK